jgi:hypothetical protein
MGTNPILGEMMVQVQVRTLEVGVGRARLASEAVAFHRRRKPPPASRVRWRASAVLAGAVAWLSAAPSTSAPSTSLR